MPKDRADECTGCAALRGELRAMMLEIGVIKPMLARLQRKMDRIDNRTEYTRQLPGEGAIA